MREALLVPVGVVMVVTADAVKKALSKRIKQYRSEKKLNLEEAPFWKWAICETEDREERVYPKNQSGSGGRATHWYD